MKQVIKKVNTVTFEIYLTYQPLNLSITILKNNILDTSHNSIL